MLTVDDYTQIREARRDGASVRALARRFRRSPKTILKVLANPQPKPYTLQKPRVAPVFDAVRSIVDDILTQDLTAPAKQRHTATRMRSVKSILACRGSLGDFLPEALTWHSSSSGI